MRENTWSEWLQFSFKLAAPHCHAVLFCFVNHDNCLSGSIQLEDYFGWERRGEERTGEERRGKAQLRAVKEMSEEWWR